MAESNLDSALVTLAALKTFLTISDSSADDQLNQLISLQSARVSQFCERKFATATYTDELYDGNGTARLYLANWPITTVTSIYESSQRVWDSTSLLTAESSGSGDYRATTDERHQGRVDRVNGRWAKGNQTIKVTYVAGYSTIPSDIQAAVFRLISAARQINIRGLHAVSSESLAAGGGNVSVFSHALPDDVRQMLMPWKRMR